MALPYKDKVISPSGLEAHLGYPSAASRPVSPEVNARQLRAKATAVSEWPQKDSGQVEETAKAVQLLVSPWPASTCAAEG